MKELKFIDLFAGIGGFHEATKNAQIKNVKFKNIGFCEIDNHAQKLYAEVHKNGKPLFHIKDVKQIKVKDIESEDKVSLPDFDVLFGGFPCQSFSNVGMRKGLEDERGELFYDILNILDFHNPNFFILENVQKLSTINKGTTLDAMVVALEEIGKGYHVHVWDLNANKYGVPQQRRRLFFCGVSKNYVKNKLKLTQPQHIPQIDWAYPTTWHLLEKEVDEVHFIPTKTRETVLRKNEKWAGNLQIDRPIAKPLTASMSKWHRANQDNYYSETYIQGNTPYESPNVNWDSERIRRITPLEGFRIQGFPDDYYTKSKELKLSNSTQYKLIGNAVPVTLAKSVIEHFFNSYLS